MTRFPSPCAAPFCYDVNPSDSVCLDPADFPIRYPGFNEHSSCGVSLPDRYPEGNRPKVASEHAQTNLLPQSLLNIEWNCKW